MVDSNMQNEHFMQCALHYAKLCLRDGEVPVGAVVVHNGEIISYGRNRREKKQNPACHAEMELISRASKVLASWRLCECDLYVTLEPCPMCAGAIINARIRKVYIGANDSKSGAVGGVCNLFDMPFNNWLFFAGFVKMNVLIYCVNFSKKLRK